MAKLEGGKKENIPKDREIKPRDITLSNLLVSRIFYRRE